MTQLDHKKFPGSVPWIGRVCMKGGLSAAMIQCSVGFPLVSYGYNVGLRSLVHDSIRSVIGLLHGVVTNENLPDSGKVLKYECSFCTESCRSSLKCCCNSLTNSVGSLCCEGNRCVTNSPGSRRGLPYRSSASVYFRSSRHVMDLEEW